MPSDKMEVSDVDNIMEMAHEHNYAEQCKMQDSIAYIAKSNKKKEKRYNVLSQINISGRQPQVCGRNNKRVQRTHRK